MRLTIAYSKRKKRNLVLINNDTYQRETLSERLIRLPLTTKLHLTSRMDVTTNCVLYIRQVESGPYSDREKICARVKNAVKMLHCILRRLPPAH